MVAGGNRKYGLYSALFASAIPFAAASTHVILTESLALVLLTLSVFLAVRFGTESGRSYIIALGISLGLLILQRPTFMLIPPLLLGYVLLSPRVGKKDIVPVVLLTVIPLCIVLTPWVLYAKSRTGSWAPVRAGVGYNIMSGILENNDSLRQTLIRYWDDVRTGTPEGEALQKGLAAMSNVEKDATSWEIASLPETQRRIDLAAAIYLQEWQSSPPPAQAVIEADNFLKKMAFLWIRNHPGRFLAVIQSNVTTLMFGDYQPLAYQAVGGYGYLYAAAVKWGLYLFFLTGTALLTLQRRFHIVFFPFAIFFYTITVHSLMHTEPRYFMYVYTFMPITVPALLPGQYSWNKSGAGVRGLRG